MRADGAPELERVVEAVDARVLGEAEIEGVNGCKEEDRVDVVEVGGPLGALDADDWEGCMAKGEASKAEAEEGPNGFVDVRVRVTQAFQQETIHISSHDIKTPDSSRRVQHRVRSC